MVEVECVVGQSSLLVGFLGGSVFTVDMDGVVNIIWATSGFGFQVMLSGSLGVSGPCIFHLYCVTWFKLS